MAKLDDPYTFSLRLPRDLGEKLLAISERSRRSLNITTRILIEEALAHRDEPRREVTSEDRTLQT